MTEIPIEPKVRVRAETGPTFRVSATVNLVFAAGEFVFEGEKEVGYKKTIRPTKFVLTHAKIVSSFAPPPEWSVRGGASPAPRWHSTIKLFGNSIRKDGTPGAGGVEVSTIALDGYGRTRIPSDGAVACEKLAQDLLAEYGRRYDPTFRGGERVLHWRVGDKAQYFLDSTDTAGSGVVTIHEIDNLHERARVIGRKPISGYNGLWISLRSLRLP